MEYSFKKFDEKNLRLENRITITKKSHSIGFPTQFYNENQISKFKYVVIYYDGEKKAIALHFTNDENEKNRFVIHHSKDGYGGSIAVRSFMKLRDIDPEKYHGRYDWKLDQIEGVGTVYIIQLVDKTQKS